MCAFKWLSLTRSRQISAVCWALILAAALCAYFFPVKTLPFFVRIVVAVVLGLAGVAAIATSVGFFTEHGDERSAENERRTDAALFTAVFLIIGGTLFLTKEGWSVVIGRRELLAVFAAVCLAKDLLFLAYERWSS